MWRVTQVVSSRPIGPERHSPTQNRDRLAARSEINLDAEFNRVVCGVGVQALQHAETDRQRGVVLIASGLAPGACQGSLEVDDRPEAMLIEIAKPPRGFRWPTAVTQPFDRPIALQRNRPLIR